MSKNNKPSEFLRGTITHLPELSLMGIIIDQTGKERFFTVSHYLDNPRTKNYSLRPLKVNDSVIFRAELIQRTVLRPIELYPDLRQK